MKIDLESTLKYWVDDRQTIPPSERHEFVSEYTTETIEQAKSMAKGIFNKEDDGSGKTSIAKSPFTIVFLVCFVLVIIGIFLQKLILIAIGFGAIFFIFGILSLMGKTIGKRLTADTLSTKLWGISFILAVIVPLIGWFLIVKDAPIANKICFAFGGVFASLSFGLITTTIASLSARSRSYNEQVNATVIGYARYVEKSGDHGRHTTIYTSPVFEYNYQGEKFTGVYDEFRAGADSDKPLGINTVIDISPKYPECIYNPAVKGFPIKLVMSIIFIVFSAVMLWLPFTSFLEGSTVNINGQKIISTSAPGRTIIGDENITYSGDDEWYVKEVSIKEIQKDDSGDICIFDDPTFIKVRTDEGQYEAGHSYYVVYTIDKELLAGDQSQGYKHVQLLIDAEEYEYQGSHLSK